MAFLGLGSAEDHEEVNLFIGKDEEPVKCRGYAHHEKNEMIITAA